MSTYIEERRQEEKDRRRVEIIEAAEELYRELGWDAVTMESVAKRARLSRALVYVYFKDKRELHLAIATRGMEVMLRRFEEASERMKAGIDKVEAIGRSCMAFSQEFPYYFDACARLEMQSMPAEGPSPQLMQCLELGERVHQVVIDAIEFGQRDGTIRPDLGDLRITSRVLWAFTHGTTQIARTKAEPLAHAGISVPQFTEHAIVLLRRMLASHST